MNISGFISVVSQEVPTDEVNVEEDEELIPVAHFQKVWSRRYGKRKNL